jgi:Integral membrane protein possibly involved in chromosome condensation
MSEQQQSSSSTRIIISSSSSSGTTSRKKRIDQQEGEDEIVIVSSSSSSSSYCSGTNDDAGQRKTTSRDRLQHAAPLEIMQGMGSDLLHSDECTLESHRYHLPSSTTSLVSSQQDSSCMSYCKRQCLVVVSLSAFAIIGSSIRMYLGRIFGLDCEYPPEQEDYISRISTCITATGLTEQRGGALFIDLPANMLGSFLLGVMTPITTPSRDGTTRASAVVVRGTPPIFPCFRDTHRIQRSSTTHLSLTVALCGSMTTFSSWNSQMVTMLVGKNAVLGSQISAAIMGYILGLACALASFSFGRMVGKALYHACRKDSKGTNVNVDIDGDNDEEEERICKGESYIERRKSPHEEAQIFKADIETTNSEMNKNNSSSSTGATSTSSNIWTWLWKGRNMVVHGTVFSLVLVSLLLISFIIGDIKMSSSFHKQMWISSLLSPPGTILRWILSRFNSKQLTKRDRNNMGSTMMGFPYGTFLANQLGCITSITAVAILSRLNTGKEDNVTTAALWLGGIKAGFAGNLSTVSTFAKEIVLMLDEDRYGLAFSYATLTIFAGSLVSLLIYILLA